MGPPGYLGGPSVVTIDSADYCVDQCQEDYPDEFCSKYPPEGVPNRPRVVEDWGTKYNITMNIMLEGIKSIHERGAKVVLSYGGRHGYHPEVPPSTDGSGRTADGGTDSLKGRAGIAAQAGGGEYWAGLSSRRAVQLAERIHKNIIDWDLDGVDFYNLGVVSEGSSYWSGEGQHPGTSATYAMAVLKNLRMLVGSGKTISYTAFSGPVLFGNDNIVDSDTAIIAAIHPYLDFINLWQPDLYYDNNYDFVLAEKALAEIEFLGIPLSKFGIMMAYNPSPEAISQAVERVKALGLAAFPCLASTGRTGSSGGSWLGGSPRPSTSRLWNTL